MCLLRKNIGQYRDHSFCPQCKRRCNLIIIARVKEKVIFAQRRDLGHL